jgi:uncharacterized RDD family membrane protein YckC
VASQDEHRPGLADAASRAALFPARAAARAWRAPIEHAADEVLASPEIARIVDRALAGPLPEELARSLIRHRVIDRIVAELAKSGELERVVTEALASPRTVELTDKALASEEMQRALGHVASSPELRDAIARQTLGLAEEVVGGVRASAVRLDDGAERLVRRRSRTERPVYAGVGTRAVALAVDAGLTIVLFTSAVGIAALVSSLVGTLRPAWLAGLLLTFGLLLLAGTYFVLFWSSAGQTPGMRLMRLRLHGPRGRTPTVGRSLVRVIGLGLSIVPLFAGFLPVLFTERRRGLPDFLAGTVVVYDDGRAGAGLDLDW